MLQSQEQKPVVQASMTQDAASPGLSQHAATSTEASSFTKLPTQPPHPNKSCRYIWILMHMYKRWWNDGCTVIFCVLKWFIWLCDLNFCGCLTGEVFKEQMQKKPTTRPHIYICTGHERVWIIYLMIPSSLL